MVPTKEFLQYEIRQHNRQTHTHIQSHTTPNIITISENNKQTKHFVFRGKKTHGHDHYPSCEMSKQPSHV